MRKWYGLIRGGYRVLCRHLLSGFNRRKFLDWKVVLLLLFYFYIRRIVETITVHDVSFLLVSSYCPRSPTSLLQKTGSLDKLLIIGTLSFTSRTVGLEEVFDYISSSFPISSEPKTGLPWFRLPPPLDTYNLPLSTLHPDPGEEKGRVSLPL